MRKALAFSFPGATLVACRRHLEKNTIHYTQDIIGMSQTERTAVVRVLFGQGGHGGLASSPDVATFDTERDRIMTGELSTIDRQLRTYLDTRYNELFFLFIS